MPDFFVLGNPRSGTSLLRLMLTNHPALCVPPECGFALWLAPAFGGDGAAVRDPEALAEAITAARKFETWQIPHAELVETLSAAAPLDYRDAVSRVYRLYAQKRHKPRARLGDKNNFYIAQPGRLRALFPAARRIYIVRDVRDVACSYLRLQDAQIDSAYRPRLSADIHAIAAEWNANAQTLIDDTGTDALHIRYEDLLDAPEHTLARVCGFLGVDFAAAMLDFYRENDEPVEFLQWKAKTRHPLDTGNKGQYRSQLSAARQDILSRECRHFLQRFGYL